MSEHMKLKDIILNEAGENEISKEVQDAAKRFKDAKDKAKNGFLSGLPEGLKELAKFLSEEDHIKVLDNVDQILKNSKTMNNSERYKEHCYNIVQSIRKDLMDTLETRFNHKEYLVFFKLI
jgi:molecular chaperone GrpE (heat shock protein)